MIFGSLFSGIGGLDLGLERAGMRCSWQVEADQYAREVLKKHWPDVSRYRDVRFFLGSKRWRRQRQAWAVDLIAGGFPCQDISNAGKRAGIAGARSGLWREFARIVRLLRPRYVLVENVDALAVRGLDVVLRDLAALGFDAEWDRIPAAAVGAPHLRWRIFILAYANGRQQGRWQQSERSEIERDADSTGDGAGILLDAASRWAGQLWRKQFAAYCQRARNLYWPAVEPGICGMDDGTPPTMDGVANRTDRLRCLGNAVVPQIAEYIGRQIMEFAA